MGTGPHHVHHCLGGGRWWAHIGMDEGEDATVTVMMTTGGSGDDANDHNDDSHRKERITNDHDGNNDGKTAKLTTQRTTATAERQLQGEEGG